MRYIGRENESEKDGGRQAWFREVT